MCSLPTRDEFAILIDEYDSLASALSYFIDEEHRPDKEIMAQYLEEAHPESQQRAVEQGRLFLRQKELSWTAIEEASNRWLKTEENARQWLTWILDVIEASLKSSPAPPQP